MKWPEARDLQLFLEVSRTENLSRAAERAGITQPALSLAMKRLEDIVGNQLLLRSKSGVKLTKAGILLAKEARTLLEDWEKIVGRVAHDEEGLKGRYIIGLHSSVALYTLHHFVPSLLEKWPGLEFKFVHDLSRRIVEEVISFKIDMAIVVNPIAHPDLVIKELIKDEVGFWKARKTTPMNDVEGDDSVLICDPDLLQAQELLGKANKKSSLFKRTLTSSNLEVIKSLTLCGSGVGIIPGRVVGQEKNLELIKNLPTFQDRICLVYRIDMQRAHGSRSLIDVISNAIKKS
ncbi:MAG: LysR family transcriptional regulator [Bacteriovoracaceae bacterium]